MPGFLTAENVVDVKNVIAVLVIVTIVLDALTRFGEHSSGISRRFVLESRIAYAVSGRKVGSQRLQRTDEATLGVSSSERRLRVNLRLQVEHVVNLGHLRYNAS